MKEIKDYLTKYTELLPLGNSVSQPEAERRASEFLVALATITDCRHALSDDKIRLLSVQTAVYAEELTKAGCKTITESKTNAEASKPYTEARESFERIENDISYLKAYYDVFMAAHVFYRNVAKGEAF